MFACIMLLGNYKVPQNLNSASICPLKTLKATQRVLIMVIA